MIFFKGSIDELQLRKQKMIYCSVLLHSFERRSYYSKLGRVITKLSVGRRVTCECFFGKFCIHELITNEYFSQIAPGLLKSSNDPRPVPSDATKKYDDDQNMNSNENIVSNDESAENVKVDNGL